MKSRITRMVGLGVLGAGLALLSAGGGAGCSDPDADLESEDVSVRHVMLDVHRVASLAPGDNLQIDLGAERVLYHVRVDPPFDWSRIELLSPERAVGSLETAIHQLQETLFDPLDTSDRRFLVTGDPSSFAELSGRELAELRSEGVLSRRASASGEPRSQPQTVSDCGNVTVYVQVTEVIDGQTFTYWVARVVNTCDPGEAGSGCADGQREGFVNEDVWPNVAGCSGAWSIPGLHTENPGFAPRCPGLPTVDTVTPACGRQAGDDAADPSGRGCDVADLCAEGWHVCSGDSDVLRSSATGCSGAARQTDPPLFFATRQSTNGCGVCANGTSTSPVCDGTTCSGGCLQTASISNDFFGCGNFGALAGCGPLNRFSHDLCSGLGAPWSCDDPSPADNSGLCEAYTARKSDSSRGGVLCCRDTP